MANPDALQFLFRRQLQLCRTKFEVSFHLGCCQTTIRFRIRWRYRAKVSRFYFQIGLFRELKQCLLLASGFLDSVRRRSLSSIPALQPREIRYVPKKADQKEEAPVVIKLDIINRVADKTGVPKMKAEQAVEALFHSMKEALTRGERIELRGFGVFVVKPRKRGVGRNPRTGEEVAIPSGKTIRFKPGKELQAHDGETDGNGEDF